MAEKSIDIAKETSVQDVLTDTTSLKATADTINANTQSAKTDSSTIKSRMGTASDGTSSATLFGKINKLLEGSGISVADVKAYLNSTVGTSGEKSLDKLIVDYITDAKNSITASGGVKCIKSVQRGTISEEGTVTISAVNTLKTIILLNGQSGTYYRVAGNSSTYGYGWAVLPYISAFTSTSFTIRSSDSVEYSSTISWQVIEFY